MSNKQHMIVMDTGDPLCFSPHISPVLIWAESYTSVKTTACVLCGNIVRGWRPW